MVCWPSSVRSGRTVTAPSANSLVPMMMATAAPAEATAAGEHGHDSVCGTSTPEAGVCYAPVIHHAPFKWSKAGLSMLIVFAGIILSWLVSVQLYTKKAGALVGLTKRNKLLAAGYAFLVNKYYLDHLYERVIVRGIAHPIAKGAYWINQNVLDGVVNGAGIGFGRFCRCIPPPVYPNGSMRHIGDIRISSKNPMIFRPSWDTGLRS